MTDFVESFSDIEQIYRTVKFVFKILGNGVNSSEHLVNDGVLIRETELGLRLLFLSLRTFDMHLRINFSYNLAKKG